MIKNQQQLINEKKKYQMKIYKETYKIIKDINKKFKKLTKEEKNILQKYKEVYYHNIQNYLIDNKINFNMLRNYVFNNKKTLFNNNKIINIKKTYNNLLNSLIQDINLLDSIIINKGEKKKHIVYRGLSKSEQSINFIKEVLKTSKKIGNTIHIKTFQSTSIDFNIAYSFYNKGGIILQIDTNNFPYYYLPWNLNMKNIKNEKVSFSEFELLLPRNITLQYEGKNSLSTFNDRNYTWKNFEKNKKMLKEIYVYKFKIINLDTKILNKNKLNTLNLNKTLNIPLSELSNIYYMLSSNF